VIPTATELPDVDLDVSDRNKAISILSNFVQASQENNGRLLPHNTGIYFQQLPIDPITGLSAFEYKIAEELGYFKVDLIPNHVYDLVESNEEIDELLDKPVNWSWFTDERFFYNEDNRYQLTHLAKHLGICQQYPPQSVEDVAILLAVIRPRKRYLIGKPREEIRKIIWTKIDEENPDNDPKRYFFKKSHAMAFALLVILHAQLIARNLD